MVPEMPPDRFGEGGDGEVEVEDEVADRGGGVRGDVLGVGVGEGPRGVEVVRDGFLSFSDG